MRKTFKSDDGKTKTVVTDFSLANRIRSGISDLVRRILLDTQTFSLTINVIKTPKGYEYDIDYGNARLPLDDVAYLQEEARNAANSFIKANPSNTGATLKHTNYVSEFDPFGLRKRLWRYLTI
ncbi:MAG: hypothetical protein ABIH49_01130 [archaeon]